MQTGEDGVHQVGRVGRNDPQVVARSVLELRGVLGVQLGQDRLTAAVNMQTIMIIIIILTIVVVSLTPYLTDTGEHIALCKINKNVYTETSYIITRSLLQLWGAVT